MPLFCSGLGEAYAYQVRTSSKRLGADVTLSLECKTVKKNLEIFFSKMFGG